jgi:hypothetical protein
VAFSQTAQPRALALTNTHAPLGQNVMSFVAELVSRMAIVGRLYQTFRYELLKDHSLVFSEAHIGALEQIAKYCYFKVSEIACHLICRVAAEMSSFQDVIAHSTHHTIL